MTDRGYLKVELQLNGKPVRRFVHRLVAEAFLGPCPPGMTINHIDYDRKNNHLSNLEYMTPAANTAHSRGRRQIGIKLNMAKAREIRSLRGTATQAEIGRRFGITKQAVSKILAGKCWADPVRDAC
ncbi:MAG: HNH endonuclease [Isosphaeraceae bacterium]